MEINKFDFSASNPYLIGVKNTGKKPATAVLFGWNWNWNKPNFGNPKQIVFTGGFNKDDYAALIAQSATKPFDIGKWRVSVVGGDNRLPNQINLKDQDADGHCATRPLLCLIDPYQHQSGIVDINNSYIIHAGSMFSVTVLPGQILYFTLFPAATVSIARVLRGCVTDITRFFGALVDYKTPKKYETLPAEPKTDLEIKFASTSSSPAYFEPPVKKPWYTGLVHFIFPALKDAED